MQQGPNCYCLDRNCNLGVALNTQVLVGAYGADAVRYHFMVEIEFGKDGDFSEERFRDKVRCRKHLRWRLAGC